MGNQITTQKIIYCKCGNRKRKDKIRSWDLFRVDDDIVCEKCYKLSRNKKDLDMLQMYKNKC